MTAHGPIQCTIEPEPVSAVIETEGGTVTMGTTNILKIMRTAFHVHQWYSGGALLAALTLRDDLLSLGGQACRPLNIVCDDASDRM
jgi:hypothetical protein